MELKRKIEDYVLGRLLVDELPVMAIQALEAGYDSPSLRLLAVASANDHLRIRALLPEALKELGITMPTPAQAGLSIAHSIAAQVLQGSVTPYQGARRIWWDVYVHFPELKQLMPFVGMASEYEDDVKHREDYSRDIVNECKTLLSGEVQNLPPHP